MRIFLLFLSSILALCVNAASPQEGIPQFPTDESMRLAFEISMQKGGLSGIMIVRQESDGIISGSLVNEFGVSAIDFTSKNGKVKLINVVKFLNKWYIRRVLSSDLGYCLHVIFDTAWKGKATNYTVRRDNDSVEVINTRHNLVYRFQPLEIETETDLSDDTENGTY